MQDDSSTSQAALPKIPSHRRRCAHAEQTLCVCRGEYPAFADAEIAGQPFWYVAYQCDRCGAVTRRDVTADDLEQPDLPLFDEDMCNHEVMARFGDTLGATLNFWQKAIRR